MKRMRLLTVVLLVLTALRAFAIDPISWRVDKNLPTSVLLLGGTFTSTYTLQSQLDWPMVYPLVVLKKFTGEYTIVDNCSGKKLVPLETCTVQITLNADISPGLKTVQIFTSTYDNNVVPLPQQVTKVIDDHDVVIVGEVLVPLPANMTINNSAPYVFQFTNIGTSSATNVQVSGDHFGLSSNCPTVLAPGASCQAGGTFQPVTNFPSTQTVSATLTDAQAPSVTVSTSTNVSLQTGLIGFLEGPSLPQKTIVGEHYFLHFKFINETGNPLSVIQIRNLPDFTVFTDGCPDHGMILFPGQICSITGSFNPTAPGNYTLSISMVPEFSPPDPATVVDHTLAVFG